MTDGAAEDFGPGRNDLTMSRSPLVLLIGLLVVLSPGRGVAAQVALPQPLQEEAMTCVVEAAQICPDVWTADDHGLGWMTGKRRSFSPRYRVIYDKVAHALRGR